MAFNLEHIKTEIADFVHNLETRFGPVVRRFEAGFHAVAGQVHDQVIADEKAAENVAAGAVTTVADQAEADVETAAAATAGDTQPTGDDTADAGK
jgi:hypothetical protein